MLLLLSAILFLAIGYVFVLIFSKKAHRVQSKLGNVFGDFARDVKNDDESVRVAGATLYTR
jgi:hypothetical protein